MLLKKVLGLNDADIAHFSRVGRSYQGSFVVVGFRCVYFVSFSKNLLVGCLVARQCFYDYLAVIDIGCLLVDLRAVAAAFVDFVRFWFPHIDLVIWQLLDEFGVGWRYQWHVVSDVIIYCKGIVQDLLLFITLIIHSVIVLFHLIDLTHIHARVLSWDA